MKKYFLFISIFIYMHSWSQNEIKEYVIHNAYQISNIDTGSTNYDDLEPIGNAIGNARIVMLGEQDHGDAPAFLAKTRLIKYLHEKKGFNVLAFESDFYALTGGWDQLPKQEDSIRSFIKWNIYPIWAFADACHNLLFNYIPGTFKTNRPLNITGIDNQVVLEYSQKNLIQSFDSVCRATDAYHRFDSVSYNKLLEFISTLQKSHIGKYMDKRNVKYFHDLLIKARQAFIENSNHDYWGTIIDNLVSLNNELMPGNKNYNETRDKEMAKNLIWLLANKYANEKVIVWAANTHIMKSRDTFTGKVLFNNMGTNFVNTDSYLNTTYILGFASYSGEAGRIGSKSYKIPNVKKGSFEEWINKEYDFAFVNFKNTPFASKNEDFWMKSPGHFYSNTKIPWNKTYDGIFFIRNMYLAKPVVK